MKRKKQISETWRPTADCIQKMRAKYPRIDIEYYIEEARDYALANGKTYSNFDAYFRNWLRRCGNFGPVRMTRIVQTHGKPAADVVEIGTIHAARERGIDTTGKTEGQLCNAIFNHDHRMVQK